MAANSGNFVIEKIFSVTCPRRSWCGRHCGKTAKTSPIPRPSLEPVTSLPLPFHTPSRAISMFYSLPPQSSFGLQCHSFDRQKGRNRGTEMRPAGKRGSVYSGERPIRHTKPFSFQRTSALRKDAKQVGLQNGNDRHVS